MVELGLDQIGLNIIFLCILFQVGSGFSGFGSKNQSVPDPIFVAGRQFRPEPSPHIEWVGSGWGFFRRIGSGSSGQPTRDQV